MGIMVYSLLWIMQDLYRQSYDRGISRAPESSEDSGAFGFFGTSGTGLAMRGIGVARERNHPKP